MGSVNFKYDYPYCGSSSSMYGNKWADKRTSLNGYDTYSMVFNNAMRPKFIKIYVEVENTGSNTVLNKKWRFYLKYKLSPVASWYVMNTFTMPSDGKYTLETNLDVDWTYEFAFVL